MREGQFPDSGQKPPWSWAIVCGRKKSAKKNFFIGALINMEHKSTILRHCCWGQVDRLGLIGKIEIDSPLENVLWVNCISGGLENHLGRQVLTPVVILACFFSQLSTPPLRCQSGSSHRCFTAVSHPQMPLKYNLL